MRHFLALGAIVITATACGSSDGEPSAASDPARAAFRPCAVCHSVADPATPAGQIRLAGPNLHGVVDAPAARRDDFAYSSAMRASNVTWDAASLNAYIENPKAFVRGNRMAFAGESDPDQRALIIDYLKRKK